MNDSSFKTHYEKISLVVIFKAFISIYVSFLKLKYINKNVFINTFLSVVNTSRVVFINLNNFNFLLILLFLSKLINNLMIREYS